MAEQPLNGGVVILESKDKATGWFAWVDLMPPGPPTLHVIGDVQVPNPGVNVFLTEKVPQGINHRILLLNLHLVQSPGIWPQHVVVKQVRFEKVKAIYDEVDVFSETTLVAQIPVQVAS
ncbi:MAG: hypothetical protein P4L84_11755 [Isosphaeraceae bacterium]|nr:hypothetical protein [Isosphaeraceae bacterium]